MRYLQEAVHIDAAPLEVWGWLVHMADHYPEWHPDHVAADWVSGSPNRIGSVMRAVEKLGDREENLLLVLTEFEPPHRYSYRIGRPVGLILPVGSFEVAPEAPSGCRFTARIGYRFGLLTELLFRRRIARLRAHMSEEGSNLKRLIETP